MPTLEDTAQFWIKIYGDDALRQIGLKKRGCSPRDKEELQEIERVAAAIIASKPKPPKD